MAHLDDAEVIEYATRGGATMLIAVNELDRRANSRANPQALKAAFKARLGVELDNVEFLIGSGLPGHAALIERRAK